MSHSKVGVVLAAAVGVTFLAMTGCASQQSGAATPANLPNNCDVVTKSACKQMATCKQRASCSHKRHARHHNAAVTTTTTTTDGGETSAN